MLHKIARIGDEKKVDRFLESNPPVDVLNEAEKHGRTALYWAVTSGDYPIVEKLIKAGADPFCVTHDGDTLITRAISLNHAHLVAPLVTVCGLSPNQYGLNNKTPLEIAGENGSLESLKALLGVGATLSGRVVHSAVYGGRQQFLEDIFCRYDLAHDWKDEMGRTALLVATLAKNVDAITYLCEKGGDVTCVDKQRKNILHYAIESGSEAVTGKIIEECKKRGVLADLLNAQALFSKNESILVIGRNMTRIVWHFVLVKRDRMTLFKKKKATEEPIEPKDYGVSLQTGWGYPTQARFNEIHDRFALTPPDAPKDITPLMAAVLKNQVSLFKMLLNEPHDLDIQDCYGLTALHLACMTGNLDVVRALVKEGAKMELKDDAGQTPLQVAKLNKNAIIETFVEPLKQTKNKELS